MAPAVIYIDNVEQVFQATKKKKGGDGGTAASRIKKDLQAAINQVKRFDEAIRESKGDASKAIVYIYLSCISCLFIYII